MDAPLLCPSPIAPRKCLSVKKRVRPSRNETQKLSALDAGGTIIEQNLKSLFEHATTADKISTEAVSDSHLLS